MTIKFVPVADDDPSTDLEPWPNAASWRARNQPRCARGHFIKKSSIRTHYPRGAEDVLSYMFHCPVCERLEPGTGNQIIR